MTNSPSAPVPSLCAADLVGRLSATRARLGREIAKGNSVDPRLLDALAEALDGMARVRTNPVWRLVV